MRIAMTWLRTGKYRLSKIILASFIIKTFQLIGSGQDYER
jgi:hypothetical protein